MVRALALACGEFPHLGFVWEGFRVFFVCLPVGVLLSPLNLSQKAFPQMGFNEAPFSAFPVLTRTFDTELAYEVRVLPKFTWLCEHESNCSLHYIPTVDCSIFCWTHLFVSFALSVLQIGSVLIRHTSTGD